jgi:hypothetical protein
MVAHDLLYLVHSLTLLAGCDSRGVAVDAIYNPLGMDQDNVEKDSERSNDGQPQLYNKIRLRWILGYFIGHYRADPVSSLDLPDLIVIGHHKGDVIGRQVLFGFLQQPHDVVFPGAGGYVEQVVLKPVAKLEFLVLKGISKLLLHDGVDGRVN